MSGHLLASSALMPARYQMALSLGWHIVIAAFGVAFPGEVTSTNGDRIDTSTVEWTLKPGVVTTMSAQSRYTDPSTRSFSAAAIWLGLAACLVAGMIAALAWRDRDRTSSRFASAESSDDL